MEDEESGGNSIATSSPSPLINWWDLHATSSLSSWSDHHHHHHPAAAAANPDSNSSSCCEDQDVSSLAVESPHRRLIHLSAPSSNSFIPSQPQDHPLWTHVLLGVGSNEEAQNSQVGENFMDALSSKSMMNEPASNYLKKLDTTWEYNNHHNNNSSCLINSSSFDNQKQLNGFNEAVLESERLSKLVSTWSIAPPDPQLDTHHQTHGNNNYNNNINTVILNSSMDHSGGFSSYGGHDMNVKQEHHHHHHHPSEAPSAQGLFGYQNNGLFNSHESYGMPSLSSCSRNLSDVISFTGRIGLPVIGIHALKPSFRPPLMSVSDSKKQAFQTSLPTRTGNGRGQGSATQVKKKRTDDSSEAILKKPKQETSTASSTKVQAPKVKLGDKITTLQQIVSPFGKVTTYCTNTILFFFSFFFFILFLQEQVQLLSNSYMKTNPNKETWGSMERKDEIEMKGELRSRGLCLVPISWTPQAYRDNTAPDYWTPAYRGCFFR
ncbi:transcription factor bHLH123 [Prosopis cineraria]|uniref:transcription factor bHLH123 n=1 Tax=Prosopis cineraria TaxID=364024 RepID=UPI00241072E9|nr:transcription factor bHLH123 [Prosopis cineraria]